MTDHVRKPFVLPIVLACAVLSLTASLPAADESGTIAVDDEQGKPLTLPYRLLTVGEVGDAPAPLIVFLHGAGERGSNNRAQMTHFPKMMLTPAWSQRFPCYLLAVQCPNGRRWVEANWSAVESSPMAKTPSPALAAVIKKVRELRDDPRMDATRVYLTGLSMGGYGSWELAMRHPDWFAALVPICGGGDEEHAAKLTRLPIWTFHGTADRVVPIIRTQRLVEAIRKAGGTVTFTTFEGVGHNSWTPAYTDMEGVIPWMFQQRRSSAEPAK